MPSDSGVPVASTPVLSFAQGAAGAAGTRHSPRPLFSGRKIDAQLGRSAPRDCGIVSDEISVVVPAKAGTHTPRRLSEKMLSAGFRATTRACGYGSLLSQGRQ